MGQFPNSVSTPRQREVKERGSGTNGAFLNSASGRWLVAEGDLPGVKMPPGQGKTTNFEKVLVFGGKNRYHFSFCI
jgi:hypothetical protein